jgi:hypothetical protein
LQRGDLGVKMLTRLSACWAEGNLSRFGPLRSAPRNHERRTGWAVPLEALVAIQTPIGGVTGLALSKYNLDAVDAELAVCHQIKSCLVADRVATAYLVEFRGTLLHFAVHSRRPQGCVIFLDSVIRTSGRATIRLGTEVRDEHIGHEPALVARSCSSAKLLGCVSVVGTPGCHDAWRCHSRGWHSQSALAAMASARRSYFRPLNGVRVSSTRSRSS